MTLNSMRLACMALSACTAIPAWADTAAFAELSNMHFKLIDLRPNDGVAPSITFFDSPGSGAGISMQNAQGGSSYAAYSRAAAPFLPAFVAHGVGDVGARARVQGDGSPQGVRLVGRSFANASHPEASYASAGATLSQSPFMQFELSPHTKLIWTAESRVSAYTSQTRWPADRSWDGSLVDSVIARAAMRIGALDENGDLTRAEGYNVGHALAQGLAATNWNGDIGEVQLRSSAPELSLVFRNRSDEAFSGALYAYASASSDTAAVPEPETYAMFLSGLAIVGWVTRRKRASARG
jgi:PEP-CTERM motif